MAGKKRLPRISAREMELLAMLWEQGPLTLPEAYERFDSYGQPVAYTTMQTRLNRLVDKGLVRRSQDRPACYQAGVKPEEVSGRQIDMLLSKVTQGKVVPLVSHLISGAALSREELDELKLLIAEVERSIEKREGDHG